MRVNEGIPEDAGTIFRHAAAGPVMPSIHDSQGIVSAQGLLLGVHYELLMKPAYWPLIASVKLLNNQRMAVFSMSLE